jgi:hypothetical protein
MILFCVTTLLQRLVFEPVINLRKTLGEVSYCLQYNAWVFHMGPSNVQKERYEKVFEELRSVTARLRADANAVVVYNLFGEMGWIPPHKNIVEATGNLIRISNNLGGQNQYVEMRDDLRTVQKLLKIDIGRPDFKKE